MTGGDRDPHGFRAVVETVRRLAGKQAIGIEESFRLLDGEGDIDLMPVEVREFLCDVLREHGYRERFMVADGADEGHLMWVRGPWPIDHGALRGKEVEIFRPF